MRILIISDAWRPQINGVVRTLEATERELRRMGHAVEIVGPEAKGWRSVAAPSYPSIKLEFFAKPRIRRALRRFDPDFIHIATEGPMGWAARNLCLQMRKPFTTSYHTRFPEYLAARMFPFLRKPVKLLAYAVLRRFHAPSSAVMVTTASMERALHKHRFRRTVPWSRGVDTGLFRPYEEDGSLYAGLPRPILLYVGRVATEKNLQAFLAAEVEGSKIIIGDGPDLKQLRHAYPSAHFFGSMEGEQLARHYAAAGLFVFPSATDTFGLVLLEAAAAGLRIASYPAPGPIDILTDPAAQKFSVLDADLGRAIREALRLPRDPSVPRAFAERYSWEACTQQFYEQLQAPTSGAVKRITRLRSWLSRSWQRALALAFR